MWWVGVREAVTVRRLRLSCHPQTGKKMQPGSKRIYTVPYGTSQQETVNGGELRANRRTKRGNKLKEKKERKERKESGDVREAKEREEENEGRDRTNAL